MSRTGARSPQAAGGASCAACRMRHASAFACLSGRDLSLLSQSRRVLRVRRNQIVFHEGAAPTDAYCVYSGRIRLAKLGPDGKLQVVRIVGPGGLFGHQAILSRKPYPGTASALEDAVLCVIKKPVLAGILGSSHALALELARRLSLDVIRAESGVQAMSQRSAEERMAMVLLELFDPAGPRRPQDGVITATRQALAEATGVATETAIRILARFKARGLLAARGRGIVLSDLDGLRLLAGSPQA